MTGTVVLHDDPQRWLAREVSVMEFLATSGLAVVPTTLIEPGPFHHDGLWMTFVAWIPDVESAVNIDDAHRLGRTLRDLHRELARFEGDLASLDDLRVDIQRLHSELQPVDASEAGVILSLRARLDALRGDVFESTLPVQALHGDVSLRNLFQTPQGLIWNDFEDTFRGPVQWDLASFVASLRNHGANPSLIRRMLDGYGWDDEKQLTPFIAAQDVYDEIWQLYDRQRRR